MKIEVFIRHVNNSERVSLGKANGPEQVEAMLAQLRDFGVYDELAGSTEEKIDPQYVLGDEVAFVEFVIGGEK